MSQSPPESGVILRDEYADGGHQIRSLLDEMS